MTRPSRQSASQPDGPTSGEGVAVVDATALDLLRRIKSLEQPDGSWPGAEIVALLCDWFTDHGIDPDQPVTRSPSTPTRRADGRT